MGRKSAIDRLPEAARRELIAWLSDPAWTREDAHEALNALLDEMGEPEGGRPSLSSVNRYAQRFTALLAKQRERHEVAETWISQFGRIPEGQLGQLIIQMVHGLAFETGLQLEELELDSDEMPGMVKMLKDLATTVERTERASQINAAREAEIRRREREQAADAAETSAKRQGVSPEGITALREAIMGAM